MGDPLLSDLKVPRTDPFMFVVLVGERYKPKYGYTNTNISQS
jgi:hypothetical protein